ELEKQAQNTDVSNKLVLVKLSGNMGPGRLSDVGFNEIFRKLYDNGAYFVMKNTSQVHTQGFEGIRIEPAPPEVVEKRLIQEHKSRLALFGDAEQEVVAGLIKALSHEKGESETKNDYEQRMMENFLSHIRKHLNL
ncbi:hypothetical protein DRJ48_04765, partial [Candidatus Woesearchaeota archaeon]